MSSSLPRTLLSISRTLRLYSKSSRPANTIKPFRCSCVQQSQTHRGIRTVAAVNLVYRAHLKQISVRLFSTSGIRWKAESGTGRSGSESKVYDFEAMKELSQNPSKDRVIVDVREPHEVQSTSTIPTAINVPLQSSPDAWFLSPEQFEDRYGFEKPDAESDEVVFYCKAGVRSRAAAMLAREAGYKKIGEYPGSYMDWEKNWIGSVLCVKLWGRTRIVRYNNKTHRAEILQKS